MNYLCIKRFAHFDEGKVYWAMSYFSGDTQQYHVVSDHVGMDMSSKVFFEYFIDPNKYREQQIDKIIE